MEKMENTKSRKRGKFFAVSNAHLDTQWNWTIVDTIKDCIKNTMDQNFSLFEKYPGYKMNFEGAFRYKLMKEYYPEKYEKVKKYIAEGRWNVCGAAWDAMDVNVPSSEALMRQILYGNNYFEEEFGKFSTDIFLPDCFGFRAALPSIEAHMGLKGFSTQKLVWGAGAPLVTEEGKTLPPMPDSDLPRMDLGRWLGPDGKGVFVSLLEGNYTMNFDQNGDRRPIYQREELLKAIEENQKISGVARKSLYFGTGDYGGACSEGSARLVSEAVSVPEGTGLFDVVSASPTDVYEGLTEDEIKRLPVYSGGLLIPHGYGAMISHTAMKRLNRQNELLADRTERASVAAALFAGEEYPMERIEEAYKTFLWHQFHDDITGTSIADAYLYSHNDMLLARNILNGELKNAISAIARRMDTSGEGTPIILYNSCAFERISPVSFPFDNENVTVYSAEGTALPTACQKEQGRITLNFLATLRPLSFTVFYIREGKQKEYSELIVTPDHLENRCLAVDIDENGNVCSIFDKRFSRELLSGPVTPEIYEDNSTVWPSWELNFNDLQSGKAETPKKAGPVEIIDLRPVSVGLRITQQYNNSTFVTTLTLPSDATRLTFDCKTCWFEKNALLTERFPLSVSNDTALFDSGLGAVSGENTTGYPYFIHNVHKWADLSTKSKDFGVTVSNDCKYAMAKPDDRTLLLCLIHTPKGDFMPASGQDYQDLGLNVYSFAIEAHEYDRGQALNGAEELNNPVTVFRTESHPGILSYRSLIHLEEAGVYLQAFKKAQKGDGYIIRVQECAGKRHKEIKMSLPMSILGDLTLCDGYERHLEKISSCGPMFFTFDLGKYEVKTFSLSLHGDMAATAWDTTPVELPYNTDVISENGASKEGHRLYLPDQLFPSGMRASGMRYKLAKDQPENALLCHGQKVALSGKYRYLRIVAASLEERTTALFKTEEETVSLSVAPLNKPVGTAESVISGTVNQVTKDDVALVFTHTHNPDGSDRLYNFAYFFSYEIPIKGAKEITLPENGNILILAAAETDRPMTTPLSELYDCYESEDEENGQPFYTLTVIGPAEERKQLKEGALYRLTVPGLCEKGMFEGFEGEGILQAEDNTALIRMQGKDMTVKANYRYLGKDLAKGKPAAANHFVNHRESPEKAVDGRSDTKWCGDADENGRCILDIDLGEASKVGSYLICHAGRSETAAWNTADFEILGKEREEDPFERLDLVEGNKENITNRAFEKSEKRYRFIRLSVTKPTQTDDTHARIYNFMVFES